MESKLKLKEFCHVATNIDDDNFVGIKGNNNSIKAFFPIGYQLPDKNEKIRNDIKRLIEVLEEYDKMAETLQKPIFESEQKVVFPMSSYINIINFYLSFGYYIETTKTYKTSTRGKINWNKTFKRVQPTVVKNGSFVYMKYITKSSSPNRQKIITKIHEYCVYSAFKKLGWIFFDHKPRKPTIKFNRNLFIYVLKEELLITYNDDIKLLFKSMINVIKYLGEKPNNGRVFFGTNKFEHVWENLVDNIFGTINKKDYFPRTNWQLYLKRNEENNNTLLQPDTIMKYDNKYYILDSKYYKYAVMEKPNSQYLPQSSSINKQITYGEYIVNHPNKTFRIDTDKLFNAFILPFNCSNNFLGITTPIGIIGEATGTWRENNEHYEHIQGIVIDTRFLMQCKFENNSGLMEILAKTIEKSLNIH